MYDEHQTPVTPPSTPPVAPPPVGYPAPRIQPVRTNGLAVASLILGILSALSGGVLFAGLAIVLAICSRREDEPMSRLAVAGVICGAVGIVFGILGTIVSVNLLMQEVSALYGG